MTSESGEAVVLSRRAVVLLSGGLDSTTTLALAGHEGFLVYALTFDYGQRHVREVDCARKIAERFKVEQHRVLKMDLASVADSALTGSGEVPKDRHDTGIPPTYVPARNLIFLTIACCWAESLDGRDIFIGVSCVDYSGYPDCRPEFMESVENTLNLATRAGTEGRRFTVHAPFLHMPKAEIIRKGIELGVDYGLTHSCYDPDVAGAPCGRCDSCTLRRKAFGEAGIPDPA